MKRLLNAVAWMLALNFLALAGFVAWLYKGGKLDHDHVTAIRQVLFPTSAPASQPTTAPAPPQEQPFSQKLDELLEKRSSLPTSEWMKYLQVTFDSQRAELDRRRRDAEDLLDQARREQAAISKERAALEAQKKELDDQRELDAKLATDKGFQDSLQRYQAMAPKQVKEIFMKLDDDITERYLEAMPPRTAAEVMKQFKSPEELTRIHKVMEKMRLQSPSTQP